MRKAYFCLLILFLLCFPFAYDYAIKKEFQKMAETNKVQVFNNIDNELPLDYNLNPDLSLVCLSGCRNDLALPLTQVQFQLKSKKITILRRNPFTLTYSYNRQ